MNELQKFKAFIKYQVLLLQQRLDIEKAKEDGRKIGLTFMGTGFLGIILEKAHVLSGLFLLLLGVCLWYFGVTERDEDG